MVTWPLLSSGGSPPTGLHRQVGPAPAPCGRLAQRGHRATYHVGPGDHFVSAGQAQASSYLAEPWQPPPGHSFTAPEGRLCLTLSHSGEPAQDAAGRTVTQARDSPVAGQSDPRVAAHAARQRPAARRLHYE